MDVAKLPREAVNQSVTPPNPYETKPFSEATDVCRFRVRPALKPQFQNHSNLQNVGDSKISVNPRVEGSSPVQGDLFRRCRRVMITDLTWPAYENILLHEMHQTGGSVQKVEVRSRLLRGEVSAVELIDLLGNEFIRCQCDGLFLPLVDNLGIRLPVSEITNHLRNLAELRFCVVDAAQAFENVPLGLDAGYCDFMIAGCHKWLCAHTPMGVGFFGRHSSQQSLSEALARWLQSGAVDDPLLVFSNELVTGLANPFGETAPILPMLTANAAAVDAIGRMHNPSNFSRQAIHEAVSEAGWEIVSPESGFESQIILIRKKPSACVKNLRRRLLENSVAATVYDDGIVRLAIPFGNFSERDRCQLYSALIAVA